MRLQRHISWAVTAAIACGAFAGRASAEPALVEIHGFVSQGGLWSTANNYLAESENGSFEFSEVGINFTKRPTDRLRIGVQLFARDLGRIGNYSAKVDWFYLDYQWKDWLGLRAGRVKLPFGLYNDTSDIDAARVPILLPGAIYSQTSRDFLLAQTGVELYGRYDFARAGALDYRAYAGTIYLDFSRSSTPELTINDFRAPYVVGGRVLWEAPVDGLRVGASVQALRLDADLTVQMMPVAVEIPAVLAIGSFEYLRNDLWLAAEYSRWFIELTSSNPALYPETPARTSEQAYVLLAYRLSPWLQPGAYYAVQYPDVERRSGIENVQHDVAGTLRFDVDANWLVKLEAHYMNGTAALSPALNGGTPRGELEPNWALFLAKLTATF